VQLLARLSPQDSFRSGITIYVVQVNFAGINVSVSVDSLLPSIRTFLEPKFYQHNFPLFDIQGLTSGDHTIDVALLDCQYNASNLFAYPNGTSALAFDYATINDQQIVTTSAPATSSTASSSSGSRAGKSIPTAAIVGGVVAGLVAIGASILLLLYSRSRTTLRNRNLVRRKTEIDPEPKVVPLHDIPYPPDEARPPSRTALLPFASSTAFNPEGLYAYSDTQPVEHTQSITTTHDTPITTLSITALDLSEHFSANSSSVIARSDATRSPSPSHGTETQPLIPAAASSQLTEEQLGLIHDLYTLNVPVTDIAGVMERMRVEREIGAGAGDERLSLVRRDSQISEVLPSYESR